MKTICLVNTESDGSIVKDDNEIVVKLADEKNDLLAEYEFYREKLKKVCTLHYKADIIHVHFYYYNEDHERIVIKPSEIKEIVCAY